MNEITTITETFDGVPITLQRRDGDFYFTAREGAVALEMKDFRQFLRLVRDHEDELLPSEAEVVQCATSDGKLRKQQIFRLSVLDLLGPLTRSDRGKKVRRWTADIRQRFRQGESAEISRKKFEALRAEFDAVVAERDRYRELAKRALPIIGHHGATIEHLARAHQLAIEYAGAMLSEERRSPASQVLRSLKFEERGGEGLFSFIEKANGAPLGPICCADPAEPLERRIVEAIRQNGGKLRRLRDLYGALGASKAGEKREVDREFKLLFNMGKVGFGPDGAFVAFEAVSESLPARPE